MFNYFRNYNIQNPWHKIGVLAMAVSVWLLIYKRPLIAAIISIATLLACFYAVKIFNTKLKNKENSILRGLEEDSSDIIRNIVTNSKDPLPDENQFSNLITRLLNQYSRTDNIPFYFFIDSDSSANQASIDNLLKKSGLVSIIDPGIDSHLEACQSNIDHYYFDWWFTSKGVIIDLSILLDGRDTEELNAGLVQIENLISFLKKFGANVVKGMIYTIRADSLKPEKQSILGSHVAQMTIIAQTISKNLHSPLDYNLLIQNAQEVEGFSDFSKYYSEAGHFSPIGTQFSDNDVEAGLVHFTDSLNAFMLLMLQKDSRQLCNSQGNSGLVHNINQLYPSILSIAKSLSDVQCKSECKGLYFIDAGDSVESGLGDPNSQYFGQQNGQSNSAVLRIMLSNMGKASGDTRTSSMPGAITSVVLLVSGLSILLYMFVDNYTKIKHMDNIPTVKQLTKYRELTNSNTSLIDKALSLIAYSVSSQLLAAPSSTAVGPAIANNNSGKSDTKDLLSRNAVLSDTALTLNDQSLHLYLLRAVYSSVRQKPVLPVLQSTNKDLSPFLESPENLVIPYEFSQAGYSVIRKNIDLLISLYVKKSIKMRQEKGMNSLNIIRLREKIVALHINAHVNYWLNLFKNVTFKPVHTRNEAKRVLAVLASKQEFSIYLKILADHHLPSYNNSTVNQFKEYLEKMDNSYNHLEQIKRLAQNIVNPKLDKASRLILSKINVAGQHNPLQKSYLRKVEVSILAILENRKITGSGKGTSNAGTKVTGTQTTGTTGTKSAGTQTGGATGTKVTGTQTGGATDTKGNGTHATDGVTGTKVTGTHKTGGKGTAGNFTPPTSNQSNSLAGRKTIIAEWNKNIYQFCARNIRRRYPVAYSANATVKINYFKQYFGRSGKIQLFYKNKLKQYIIVSRGPYRWNKAGKELKLGNRILRHIEAVQTIKRAWFRGGSLQLTVNVRPEFLSRNAVRFELTLGRSYIGYERRGKQYKKLKWSPRGRGWVVHYAFLNGRDDLIEGRFPRNKWFWVRFMNRTLRGRNGLIDIQDRGYRMLFHLERTRAAVHQFKVINNYSCLKL